MAYHFRVLVVSTLVSFRGVISMMGIYIKGWGGKNCEKSPILKDYGGNVPSKGMGIQRYHRYENKPRKYL